MKSSSPIGFIKSMYWFFRIAFWLQLLIVVFLLAVNYFMVDGRGPYFTVRGAIHATETGAMKDYYSASDSAGEKKNWIINKYGVATWDTVGSSSIFFINILRSGFIRIDYTDFSKAFSPKNIGWFLCEVSLLILWLLVTYQLMKIFQSLKNESVFVQANIKRITIIGCVVLLAPFIELARDVLFYHIINQYLSIPGYEFYAPVSWWDFFPNMHFSSTNMIVMSTNRFPFIALGLIILVIAQIFKRGFELQKEKDLTI